MKAAAWALLLSSLIPAPVRADSAAQPDAAETNGAVIRPTSVPGRPAAAKVSVHAKRAAPSAEDGADDPESRPIAAYDRSPSAAPAGDTSGLAISVLGKTGLVVALMLVCAAGWKRLRGAAPLGGLQPAQAVQVTSTVSLGPQRFLHLVTIGRHQLLVGSAPQNVSLIAVLEGGSATAPECEAGTSARGLSAQGPPPEADSWADGRDAPADRFEELLLRLRDLEHGPYEGEPDGPRAAAGRERGPKEPDRDAPPAAGASRLNPLHAAGQRYERDAGPRGGAPLETGWMGRSGGESAPPARGEEVDRPLTPGSLFRTSRRAGADASRSPGEIDA